MEKGRFKTLSALEESRMAADENKVEIALLDSEFKHEVAREPGGENITACFQCSSCTLSGPITELDDGFNPRRIIRKVLLGMREDVLSSEDIWNCAGCLMCYERCPQNVRFTDVVESLRRIALKESDAGRIKLGSSKPIFDRAFAGTIRRYGRIFEPEMMTRYLLFGKGPIGALGYTELGLRMFLKGKIPLLPHWIEGSSKVRRLFGTKGGGKE